MRNFFFNIFILLFFITLKSNTTHEIDPSLDTSARFTLSTGVGTGNPYLTTVNSTQFTVDGSLVQTYTISSSGLYTFVGDIAYQATEGASGQGGATALFIDADNVVIDLNGRTIYNNNGADNNALTGIEIASNRNNITIKNGTINEFGTQGILVNDGCSAIFLKNISISNCNIIGIYFKGTSGNPIKGALLDTLSITNINYNAVGNACGIFLNYTQDTLINNTIITNVINSNGDAYGILANGSKYLKYINTTISSTRGKKSSNFHFVTAIGSIIENCNSLYSSGSNGDSFGYHLIFCKSVLLKNCISSKHTASSSNCYGFYNQSSANINLKNCFSYSCSNSSAGATTTAGFYTTTTARSSFTDCKSVGHQTANNASAIAAGFILAADCTQNTFQNCTAQANGNQSSAGNAYGFYFGNNSTNTYNSINNCLSLANICNASGAAKGFYDISTNSTNMFVNNFAFGNTNSSTTDNYDITVVGTFPEVESGIGGITALSGKPYLYNVSIWG